MSPIEEHLREQLQAELADAGVRATVEVLSAEAENWRHRVTAARRVFEIGFNHADAFWARETTPGGEKHLISNDHPRVHDSAAARALGIRLIAAAVCNPSFPPRDPPPV